MKHAAAILLVLIMTVAPALAGTIYIWTDNDGVKQFSDHPPEGGQDYETAVSSKSKPSEGKREGLEKMLQEHEVQQAEDRAKEKEAEAIRKAEEEREARAQKSAETRAEREQLEQKIEALRKRALSPTFTEGMRQNQINEIQKQIDSLD